MIDYQTCGLYNSRMGFNVVYHRNFIRVVGIVRNFRGWKPEQRKMMEMQTCAEALVYTILYPTNSFK
jgi:hypothetical protein